jgi:NADH-quinone oxidoreductase subunit L
VIQFAAQYPWLIPFCPLLACVFIALFGTKLKGLAHIPAIVAMLFSAALALTLLYGLSSGALQPIRDLTIFDWIFVNHFHIPFAVTIDQLTAIYLSFITGIGLLIFIFAAGYMKGDYGYWRFFAYLSIFVFFMTVLVMGNSFITLYLGWEGVGLASYLLIGYYYPRPSAVAAAKKAFITNRIGDFFLAIGIFLIYTYFGTVQYSAVFAKLGDAQFLATYGPMLKYIPFCLMIGAFGKSAQFPLHVWLPDAMEGPTPVSALIHAATMVTAGIYLIARTMPLFVMDPSNHLALDIVGIVGGITAFLAASIALCQYDLKKIWAYSTLSQLGYMFMGLGVMASTSAVFHVFTHAFFKALLFLSAGSVMHAMGGELDIRKMSGIRKVMPITNVCMLIGCIALAGVPGFAGYFSKDEIISHAINAPEGPGFYLGILGLLVALMTAFYTFRLYFKVFTGPLELPATAGHHEPSPFALSEDHAHDGRHTADGIDTIHAKQGHEEASHGEDEHGNVHHADAHDHAHAHAPNDGSPLLWIPLLVLCVGAIGAGYLGIKGTGDWFHHFLSPALGMGADAAEGVQRVPESLLRILGILIPFAGIAIAFYFFKLNRLAAANVGQKLAPLVKFLYNKWYIDEIYSLFIIKPLWILAHILAGIDRFVIDGLVFIVSFIPSFIGYSLKPTQRGVLQRYAVGMIAGLAAVILGVMYLHLLH